MADTDAPPPIGRQNTASFEQDVSNFMSEMSIVEAQLSANDTDTEMAVAGSSAEMRDFDQTGEGGSDGVAGDGDEDEEDEEDEDEAEARRAAEAAKQVMHVIRDAQKAGITCNKTGAAAILDASVELNSMSIKTVKDLKEAMELEDGGKFTATAVREFLTAKRQEAHDAGLPADKQTASQVSFAFVSVVFVFLLRVLVGV